MFPSFSTLFGGAQRAPTEPKTIPRGRRRRRIGLALGGGAARGWAHIGVIQRLKEAGIVPDMIAGTSIGAVAGGCASADKLDELEDFARGLTPRRVLGLLDLTLGAPGLIGGRKLAEMLETKLEDMRVEHLPRRFVAVSTDVLSGHEVWITRGPLARAIEASYALPGVFPPIRHGGRWLIDGAFVNPVPISACRAADMDLVIAVTLHAEVQGRGSVITDHGDDLDDVETAEPSSEPGGGLDRIIRRQIVGQPNEGQPGLSTVIGEAFNITQDRIARARLAGDPPDVIITPRMPKVGLFDFHKAAEAIAAGRDAAERALDDLEAALVSLSA